jgi:hypothetical protein
MGSAKNERPRVRKLVRFAGHARWKAFLACTVFLVLAPAHGSGGRPNSQIDGVTYQNYVVDEVPWSIHVIKIERNRSDFEVMTTLGGGSRIGLNTLTRQLRTIPKDAGTPIAAINGDFYSVEHDNYPGDPRGLHIRRGELVSDPAARTCVWFDEKSNPKIGDVRSKFSVTWPNGENTPMGLNEERAGNVAVLYTAAIGASTETAGGLEFILEKVSTNKWLPLRPEITIPARVREIRRSGDSPIAPDTMVLSLSSRRAPPVEVGDILILSTATEPSLAGARAAIGGGPWLVRAGKAAPGSARKGGERHPRSAIGWNSKHLFFVEVDGRQPGLSKGMNLRELADFLAEIGCEEAMNLDGGGSAEVWLNGRILNSPCYGRERSTGSAVVLLKKKVEGQP